jgi:hypothetical protein
MFWRMLDIYPYGVRDTIPKARKIDHDGDSAKIQAETKWLLLPEQGRAREHPGNPA